MTLPFIHYTLHEFGTSGEGKTHLVYGIDENFIRGASVCIASAALNSNNGICAHIIYGQKNVSPAVSDVLNALVVRFERLNIRLYAIEDFAAKLIVTESLTSAMYYRYCIGELLYGITERVIYLDADIVADCNLDELYRRDMKGYLLAAVEDYMPDGDIPNAERMRAFFEGEYFNSGMLMIDVAGWKSQNIFEKAIEKTVSVGVQLKHYDQDVLNIIFANSWLSLEKKWNYISYREEPCSGVVAHFIGNIKPWMRWSDKRGAKLYDHYESMTFFNSVPKELPKKNNAKEVKYYKRYLYNQGCFLKALYWECVYIFIKAKNNF